MVYVFIALVHTASLNCPQCPLRRSACYRSRWLPSPTSSFTTWKTVFRLLRQTRRAPGRGSYTSFRYALSCYKSLLPSPCYVQTRPKAGSELPHPDRVAIRLNSTNTHFFEDDLAAAVSCITCVDRAVRSVMHSSKCRLSERSSYQKSIQSTISIMFPASFIPTHSSRAHVTRWSSRCGLLRASRVHEPL